MTPDDPRHGTYAGAVAHYEHGQQLCADCREAKRTYNRRQAKLLRMGHSTFVDATLLRRHIEALCKAGMTQADIARGAGSSPETVRRIRRGDIERVKIATARRIAAVTEGPSETLMPLAPSRRRIQALAALGYELRWISAQLGVTPQHLANWIHDYRAGVTRIHRSSHDQIKALYEAHCMTPGPSARTRGIARKNGWVPPLAWNDIDDPDETPAVDEVGRRRGHPGRIAAHIEDIEWMADTDCGVREAAERLGVLPDTLRTICARAGRLDLYERLSEREPDADHRRATRQAVRKAS